MNKFDAMFDDDDEEDQPKLQNSESLHSDVDMKYEQKLREETMKQKMPDNIKRQEESKKAKETPKQQPAKAAPTVPQQRAMP
jgi:hypothetical protein